MLRRTRGLGDRVRGMRMLSYWELDGIGRDGRMKMLEALTL
jgi:hypothetical protein